MSPQRMAWEWNPSYAGTPRILDPACHDGSPMIDVKCSCGTFSHVHETAITAVPLDSVIATSCPGCGDAIEFAPGELAGAFAVLRREGWIAPKVKRP